MLGLFAPTVEFVADMSRARQEDNLELARYRSGQVMAGFSQEATMICSVGNDSGKGVAWWVVPIALRVSNTAQTADQSRDTLVRTAKRGHRPKCGASTVFT